MNKTAALRKKRSGNKPVIRRITDKIAAPKSPLKISGRIPAGVSIASPGPGFKQLTKGGYRAFLPGPAAKRGQSNMWGAAMNVYRFNK